MIFSTSRSNPAGRRGPSLAVIDTPLGPPGWEDARARLVRIVDPRGRAVAWFAPDFGGICVGFAVRPSGRREGGWVHILHSVGPDDPRDSPDASGLGVCYAPRFVPSDPSTADPCDALLPTQPWRFIERDPTAVVLETAVSTDAGDRPKHADAAVRLRLTAGLEDGTLVLNLDAWHQGAQPIPLRLGFQVNVARDLFGGSVSVGLAPPPAEHVNERIVIPDNTALAPGDYELRPRIDDGKGSLPPRTEHRLPPRVRLIAALGVSSLLLYPPRSDGTNALMLLACAPAPVEPLPGNARFSTRLSLTVTANDENG